VSAALHFPFVFRVKAPVFGYTKTGYLRHSPKKESQQFPNSLLDKLILLVELTHAVLARKKSRRFCFVLWTNRNGLRVSGMARATVRAPIVGFASRILAKPLPLGSGYLPTLLVKRSFSPTKLIVPSRLPAIHFDPTGTVLRFWAQPLCPRPPPSVLPTKQGRFTAQNIHQSRTTE
jgi:hypothetical protein